jgi:iduronate 2-sulfatase
MLVRAAFLVLLAASPSIVRAQQRTNVLFIIADDYNITTGVYGNRVIRTPNLDRLAARGVRFDRAYCQYPLCSPSRTSFLSGRRPDTTGISDNRTLPRTHLKDAVFLPQYFRSKGYFTARVGKIFHATRFLKDGQPFMDFDDPACWNVSISELLKLPERLRQNYTGTGDEPTGDDGKLTFEKLDLPDEDTGDGVVAREGSAIIDQQARAGKPFFVAAGFRRPHLPWWAPRKYFDMYPPAKMRPPFAPANDLDDIPPIALTRIEKLPDNEKREFLAAYYASVTFMDAQVGKLLATLDRHKLWDRTVIVFIGDHGYHLGEHNGLWKKQTVFEECARAPLLVVAPGMRAGVSTRLVEFVDIYPTLTALAGLPQPAGLEGTSFAPLLQDPARPWKSAAFTQVVHRGTTGRSVRTERYRYTEWGGSDTAELYDHDADPHEFTNLVKSAGHAAVLEDMRRRLQEGWRKAVPQEVGKSSSAAN